MNYVAMYSRYPLHVSWHCMAVLAGVLMGIVAARAGVSIADAGWLVALAGALGVVAYYGRWYGVFIVVSLLAGGGVGVYRGAVDIDARSALDAHIGRAVSIQGTILEDPEVGKQGMKTVRLGDISIQERSYVGKVWVTVSSQVSVQRSDRIVVQGKLSDGFAQFSAALYRADVRSVQRSELNDPLLGVRDQFSDKVRGVMSDIEASLGLGFLVGQRRGLPPDILEVLKLAGLTHIIVASGYNVTILVRIARRFFQKYSRFLTLCVALGLIVAFIGVTGASPSMIRAGMVAGLALAAWYIGRRYHPMMLILLAAAATALYDPSFVWGDMGWQLSFAAFFGVMIVGPLAQAWLFGKKPPGLLRQVIGETIAAQIVTAPLILYAFGSTSLIAVVANVLVVPLVPLAMLLVAAVGGVAYVSAEFAQFLAVIPEVVLKYMLGVAEWAAAVPGAQYEQSLSLAQMVLLYTFIGFWCVYMRIMSGYCLRKASIVE